MTKRQKLRMIMRGRARWGLQPGPGVIGMNPLRFAPGKLVFLREKTQNQKLGDC